MAKQYKGSLTLEWYNKQKAILLQSSEDTVLSKDVAAPKINWINKEEALFYEYDENAGKGVTPYWVDRNDIRIKEARPLLFKKGYNTSEISKKGTLPGLDVDYKIEETNKDDQKQSNILIKGDNLLALNSLKKIFDNKPDEEKVKCIYIDPPYNTGSAFIGYEDNLAHSEWLTMMRDRLSILRELMRNDGVIFVHLDNSEQAYLKLLLDEVFGRENFIETITVVNNPRGRDYGGVANMHEFIHVYAKTEDYVLHMIHDENKEFPFKDEISGFETRELRNRNTKFNIDNRKNLCYPFYLNKKNQDENGFFEISLEPKEGFIEVMPLKSQGIQTVWRWGKEKSSENLNINIVGKESTGGNYQIVEKYRKKTRMARSVWFDKEVNSERGTLHLKTLFKSKVFDYPKPEETIQRILEIGTSEGDLVLDCFSGSGTTVSVAHKMRRRWIGIEVGNHMDSIIIERLKLVIQNKDSGGVTNRVKWTGGGSFKYYHLGESIIRLNNDGIDDFNWTLGREFIQESFLSSYDYSIDNTVNFQEGQLFNDKQTQPIVGVQTIGSKIRVAVITLNEPKGKLHTLSYDEMQSIYKTIKKKYSPEYINIFTNRGIDIAFDSKPEDLEVIKIPNAIFAELEK